MKRKNLFCLQSVLCFFVAAILIGCGDDDSFSPVSRDGHGGEKLESSASRNSSSSYSTSDRSSSSKSLPALEKILPEFNLESKEDAFNPDIDYGEMTDPRDGKKYRTVDVNGVTWMAENLNFADSSVYPVMEKRNHCYKNIESDCDLLGRFYNKASAMNNATLGVGSVQGICPDGWHIPSTEETQALIDAADGFLPNLRSERGWGDGRIYMFPGLNTLGMSFVGAGQYPEQSFLALGLYAKMWVNSDADTSVYLLFQAEANDVLIYKYDRDVYAQVRCVQGEAVITGASD